MYSSSRVTLRCRADPTMRLRRRDRRGSTGVNSIEPCQNFGGPRRFSVGVDLAFEALNQLASECRSLFLRESESFCQELLRIHKKNVSMVPTITGAPLVIPRPSTLG